MAIIANFDTAVLEGLVTDLSAAETTLDNAITALGVAQATENSAESGAGSTDASVAHAAAILAAPLGEGAVAERLERSINLQKAVLASGGGGSTLTAASAAVTAAMGTVTSAQTAKNVALAALTAYIDSIN